MAGRNTGSHDVSTHLNEMVQEMVPVMEEMAR